MMTSATLFSTCKQRHPWLCLGHLGRNMGLVGRTRILPWEFCWVVIPEKRGSGDCLLSVRVVRWDAVVALRKMETIWNSWCGLGTMSCIRVESRPPGSPRGSDHVSRCGVAVQEVNWDLGTLKVQIWGQGLGICCAVGVSRSGVRAISDPERWLSRELLRWTAGGVRAELNHELQLFPARLFLSQVSPHQASRIGRSGVLLDMLFLFAWYFPRWTILGLVLFFCFGLLNSYFKSWLRLHSWEIVDNYFLLCSLRTAFHLVRAYMHCPGLLRPLVFVGWKVPWV